MISQHHRPRTPWFLPLLLSALCATSAAPATAAAGHRTHAATTSSTTPAPTAAPAVKEPVKEPVTEPFMEPFMEPAAGDPRPNIVFISTDDQTVSDLAYMPYTRKLIGHRGVRFTDMLSPHPLCCPARAEMLTGQYTQNNGVRSNTAKYLGGYTRFDPANTIATWLHAAGYQTAMVGKYLNEYGAKNAGPEPGWDIWNPTLRKVYQYFDYTMYNEGHPRRYRHLHNADLVARKTVAYIHRMAADDRPFFLWSSQVAPHGSCDQADELACHAPPKVAKRHRGLFAGLKSPSLADPAYNEKNISDKPHNIAKAPFVDDAFVNELFRHRIRSLQAVDEGVRDTVRALREVGELDNTLLVFTSDNGYLLGEHRHLTKNVPYKQALEVPLLVRGPGIPRGVVRHQTAAMIDLAPTFLDVAHAVPTIPVDGRSLLPVLHSSSALGDDTVLIQAGPRHRNEVRLGWAYRGVRTRRYTYARETRSGFVELYDRARDPAELRNVAGFGAYAAVQAELARRLAVLKDCSGVDCQITWKPMPAPQRTRHRSHRHRH